MSFSSNISLKDLTLASKLRCLKPKERNKLAAILLINNSWQELAGIIRDPDKNEEFLYAVDDINLLDSQKKLGRNPAEGFLEHWSTYGKCQPDLNTLLMYLKEADLMRAAHFVETELLKNGSTDSDQPTEEICTIQNKLTTAEPSPICDIDEKLHEINLNDLQKYPFEVLFESTKRFSDARIEGGGCKIGEGTYGAVYQAIISNKVVAVKKLKDKIDKQFFTELKILARYKHENLLCLLGYSIYKTNCCLVYEYMENGSLQERLACYRNSSPLSPKIRMSIAYGAALGINHLHTFEESPMVHRDIKSANILLDANYVPKVGDFGLVRIADSNASSTVAVTENVFGTCVYMAREAFNGDVSVKLDTFSFGVVLLELITGLPPYDVNREDRDLITYMENCDDISTMLDKKVIWNTSYAIELYKIACFCLTGAKKKRPSIAQILPDLERCCSNYQD